MYEYFYEEHFHNLIALVSNFVRYHYHTMYFILINNTVISEIMVTIVYTIHS